MASSNSVSSFAAVNEEFSHLDLTGKILIKVQFGNEIRRLPIHNDEITFNELLLMMQRLFKLQPSDEIEIKYRDEDNDLILITDDNDLSFAIQCSRYLKLNIVPKDEQSLSALSTRAQLIEVRRTLVEIRNQCGRWLKVLDQVGSGQLDYQGATCCHNVNGVKEDAVEQKQEKKNVEPEESKKPQVFAQPPKELDPLNGSQDNKQSSSECFVFHFHDIDQLFFCC